MTMTSVYDIAHAEAIRVLATTTYADSVSTSAEYLTEGDVFTTDGVRWYVCAMPLFDTIAVYVNPDRNDEALTIRIAVADTVEARKPPVSTGCRARRRDCFTLHDHREDTPPQIPDYPDEDGYRRYVCGCTSVIYLPDDLAETIAARIRCAACRHSYVRCP